MALVWTKTANPAFQASGSPVTFSSVSIGAEAADRIVVVCVHIDGGGTISGVTVAGGAADQVINLGTASIWQRAVSTGTTADIVVTATYIENCCITVGKLTGAASTATDTASYNGNAGDPRTCGPITIPSGGVGVVAFSQSDSTAQTLTWNTGTEDYNTLGTGRQLAMGYSTTSGDVTFSISGLAFYTISAVAAAWEPSGGGGGGAPGSIVFTITL